MLEVVVIRHKSWWFGTTPRNPVAVHTATISKQYGGYFNLTYSKHLKEPYNPSLSTLCTFFEWLALLSVKKTTQVVIAYQWLATHYGCRSKLPAKNCSTNCKFKRLFQLVPYWAIWLTIVTMARISISLWLVSSYTTILPGVSLLGKIRLRLYCHMEYIMPQHSLFRTFCLMVSLPYCCYYTDPFTTSRSLCCLKCFCYDEIHTTHPFWGHTHNPCYGFFCLSEDARWTHKHTSVHTHESMHDGHTRYSIIGKGSLVCFGKGVKSYKNV